MKILILVTLTLLSLSLVLGESTKEGDQLWRDKKDDQNTNQLSDEYILQKHGSFFGSFISTTISEIGDKTFIMTAILSSKYSKFWVFIGNVAAMILMTLISCFIGSLTEYFLPLQYVKLISSGLFLFFGCKLLYEVYTDTVDDEDDEAEEEVEELEKRLSKIVKKPKSDEDSNDSSESASPDKIVKNSKSEEESKKNEKKKKKKHLKGISAPGHVIAMQTFVSNFFGEWGDRSQISTVAVSASFDFWKVFFGTFLGQVFCTLLALIGGQILAKQFSEKTMAFLGGILFLIFGGITFFTAV